MAIIQEEIVHMLPNPLFIHQGSSIYYRGPDLQEGVQPTLFYFALSGYASLYKNPFNQLVTHLNREGIGVFSWDLPFHEMEKDPHESMRQWLMELTHHPASLFEFLDLCKKNIDFLIHHKVVNRENLAVAGLSRGAFIATHLAARESKIKKILGFAPLTRLRVLDDIHSSEPLHDQIDLTAQINHLIQTSLRFYIGNHDTLVGTNSCFTFIHSLSEAAYHQGIRSPNVELIIYPSIGHKGHGTPPSIFKEGSEWMIKQLIT